ncbi:MAG TPA: ATP-binding cassette domain-containing protein, partial [Xanthobacteraceae bacterium]
MSVAAMPVADAGPRNQSADPLLAVDHLTVRFQTPDGPLTAVDDFSLTVSPKEFLGVIGPSGCGKTTVFNAV